MYAYRGEVRMSKQTILSLGILSFLPLLLLYKAIFPRKHRQNQTGTKETKTK